MARILINTLTPLEALVALAGCASRASTVAPTAVPSANYKGLSCAETRTMLAQKQAQMNALTKQQNNAATGDAASVFLFELPLGSVFGADLEDELAKVNSGRCIAPPK